MADNRSLVAGKKIYSGTEKIDLKKGAKVEELLFVNQPLVVNIEKAPRIQLGGKKKKKINEKLKCTLSKSTTVDRVLEFLESQY